MNTYNDRPAPNVRDVSSYSVAISARSSVNAYGEPTWETLQTAVVRLFGVDSEELKHFVQLSSDFGVSRIVP